MRIVQVSEDTLQAKLPVGPEAALGVDFVFKFAKLLDADMDTLGKSLYLFHLSSLTETPQDWFLHACASCFLAFKIQDLVRDLENVAVCYLYTTEGIESPVQHQENDELFQSSPVPLNAEKLRGTMQRIERAEETLIRNIGFDFQITTPYEYLEVLRLQSEAPTKKALDLCLRVLLSQPVPSAVREAAELLMHSDSAENRARDEARVEEILLQIFESYFE